MPLVTVARVCPFRFPRARVVTHGTRGGRSSGGGSGGGGAGFIIWLIFRLILLTVEYPVIGIPLDIIIIGVILYAYFKKDSKPPSICSADAPVGTTAPRWKR